jgi:catechol 2,3-dioxygenase-like lactoylglutathione lyase family enzyme
MMVFKATPTGPSDGSAANHVGFVVKDYADIKAKLVALGAKQAFDLPQQKQMMYEIADGIRMEFFEDPAIPTTAPVTFHHMHLSVPDPDATGAWYVKVFGAEAGTRRNLPAAKFPGGEVDFIKAAAPRGAAPGTPVTVAPSKGRSIDHIGFEVKNLKAFTDKLEADGIPFDMEYRDMSQQIKLKIAFIVDPVGTRIELTEGLAGQ